MENKNKKLLKVCVLLSLFYSTFLILSAYGLFSGPYNYFKMESVKLIFGSAIIFIFISWPWTASYMLARSKEGEMRVISFVILTIALASLLFFGKRYSSDNANGFMFVVFSWVLYPVTRLLGGIKNI